MCGILGFIGYNNSFDISFQGLKMLLNRGYDSCGCAGIKENKLIIHKYANILNRDMINLLESHKNEFDECQVLINHSRWATNGAKTDENAHPHVDFKNKIALVHNGIIENYIILKKELEKEGIHFKSQTDTEVIVNLIGYYYHQKHKSFEDSIIQATNRLHGTWALVIICVDIPNKLFCVRHGSPLLIGFGDNFMIATSEQSGFCGNVKDYICLNNKDIIILEKKNGKVIFEQKDLYQIKNITISDIVSTPFPYNHWTLKEINEQVDSSKRSINFGARLLDDDKVKLGGLDKNIDKLMSVEHLILLGCGTSLNAGIHGVSFFKELANFNTVQAFDAGEFHERDIPKYGKTVLVLLSQSGETNDVYRCITIAKKYNLFTIGIINVVDSLIAREVDCGVYLNAGKEIGVASTKAFTSQIIVLSLVAIWFSQNKNINDNKRKEYIRCLRNLSADIKQTIKDVENDCKIVADFLKDKTSCFILGKGLMESYAREGALKIKEISYIHAEGYSAVSLKHGPFSLLDENIPVIITNPYSKSKDEKENLDYMRVQLTIEEVASRCAPIILITNKRFEEDAHDENTHKKEKFYIKVPTNGKFEGILHLIPMQLIAYYLALNKGLNPDMPKNLAKCVTVL